MSRGVRIPELVVPAGDLECFRVACRYGADAVYVGTGAFNMRARARNFDWSELDEAMDLARDAGVKVYVTMNVLLAREELEAFRRHLRLLLARKPDAIILTDPGAIRILRELDGEQRIHLSTQASVSNPEAAAFWFEAGVSRINLARELPGRALPAFRELLPDLEVEVFVHGSMCIAYSGHCLLSSALAGRSANRGACAQSCRWDWALVEAKRPETLHPIEEEGAFTTLLSSRDLCLAREIPFMAEAGVDGLKVEGRMKGPLYVATVTRTYRAILDALAEEGEAFSYRDEWDALLKEPTHRPFGKGFWEGRPADGTTGGTGYRSGSSFLGRVEALAEDPRRALVVARQVLRAGQDMILRHPDEGDLPCTIRKIESYTGRTRDLARSGDLLWIEADRPLVVDAVLVAPKGDGRQGAVTPQ